MGEYDVMDIAGVHTKFSVALSRSLTCWLLLATLPTTLPGVKGIGEKTIRSFSTARWKVFDHFPELKDSVRKSSG